MTPQAPILSVVCNEAKGKVTRNIYPLILTRDNLAKFWQKGREFKTLFNKELKGNFEEFINTFISVDDQGNYSANGLFWVVDDFIGVLYLTNITTNGEGKAIDALAHFTFFDRKLYGRQEVFKQLLRHIFDKYKLRRITAEVPMFLNKRVLEFLVNDVGLKKEGFKRNAAFYNNDYFGVAILGILPEDLEVSSAEKVTEDTTANTEEDINGSEN